MNNLSAAIIMTSQGVPFFQAGEEMLRSKPKGDGTYDHNSYKSSDEINNIKWDDLNNETYMDTVNYYKGLIEFRKAHPALRMTSADLIKENITSMEDLESNVLAFQINGGVNGEPSDGLFVIFNPRKAATTVTLPEGNWTIYVNGEDAGTTALGTAEGSVSVDAISAMVLVKAPDTTSPDDGPAFHIGFLIPIIAAVVIAGVAVTMVIVKKRKNG